MIEEYKFNEDDKTDMSNAGDPVLSSYIIADTHQYIRNSIISRNDTLENWKRYNPILNRGEIAFAWTDGGVIMKVGDGWTKFMDLPELIDINKGYQNGN